MKTKKHKVELLHKEEMSKPPEVVHIENCIYPQTLMLMEDGKVYMMALDGMSSAPLDKWDRIITIPRKRQLRYLTKTFMHLLRKLALMGEAPGCREMRRMCARAAGLRWKDPEGVTTSGATFLTADEAVQVIIKNEKAHS